MTTFNINANGRTRERDGIPATEIATAGAYLRLLTPRKTVPRGGVLSSYGLKHHAEDWGRANGMAPYVSNGALIAAAVALGLPVRTGGSADNPNVAVGVRAADVERIARDVERLTYGPRCAEVVP
jgi:hypothetical protein